MATETIRCFVALSVPEAAITYATMLQQVFHEQGIRGQPVRPEAMHLTAAFLGDQTESQLQAYEELLRQRLRPLPAPVVDCIGPDTFGRPPSVLFVGWSDPEHRFRKVAEQVRETAQGVELAPPAGSSKRKPVPHMTILRVKDPRSQKRLRHLQRPAPDGPAWKPFLPPIPPSLLGVSLSRVQLMASTLTSEGPIYRRLAEFPLLPSP